MAEATAVSFRKGTKEEHDTFRGVKGEITVDLTDLTVWVHPGSQVKGNPLARADMANVDTVNIAARGIARSDLKNINISVADLPDIKQQLDIPTKTSDLDNDSGFITPNEVSTVVGNGTVAIKKNSSLVGSFTANTFTNVEIDIPVPTTTSQLTNNSGFITNTVNNLTNYTKSSDLANVAISGSYSDLLNTPNLATVATSGSYIDLINKPNLATVATTGNYTDLIGTPTIIAPVQSDWDETDGTKLAFVMNKPILINNLTVAASTGVLTIHLSESFDDPSDPNRTPLIKTLVGGTTIAGTWAAIANTNKKQWTFTPSDPGDVLDDSWIVVVNE